MLVACVHVVVLIFGMDSSPASSAAERLCCHRTAAFSLRFVADEETRRRSLMSSSSVERARGREHKAPRLQLLRLVIRRSPGAGTSHQLLVVISVRSPSAFERRACWQALRLSDLATRNQPRSNPCTLCPSPSQTTTVAVGRQRHRGRDMSERPRGAERSILRGIELISYMAATAAVAAAVAAAAST